MVSPDAGYAKTARKYADYLHAPVAIGDKTRYGHDEAAKILSMIGDVNGKNCMIVDDFSVSGGTLVDVANTLKNNGAKRIIACISHVIVREKRHQGDRGQPHRDGDRYGQREKSAYRQER